jgi:hypothetical protein
MIDGETVDTCGIFNLDWEFRHFLETGKFMGGCADESSVANAFLMSIGIASTITSVRWGTTGYTGHFHVTYYDPPSKTWKIYGEQLGIDKRAGSGMTEVNVFYLFVPPANERGYTYWYDTIEKDLWIWKSGAWHTIFPITLDEVNRRFSVGVPTSEVKQWLLYSQCDSEKNVGWIPYREG